MGKGERGGKARAGILFSTIPFKIGRFRSPLFYYTLIFSSNLISFTLRTSANDGANYQNCMRHSIQTTLRLARRTKGPFDRSKSSDCGMDKIRQPCEQRACEQHEQYSFQDGRNEKDTIEYYLHLFAMKF